jgi:hypothetical protein
MASSDERVLAVGDFVRFLSDVTGMSVLVRGASKGALGHVNLSPAGSRVGVRVLTTGTSVCAARAQLAYVPPQPLGEEGRLCLLKNAEREVSIPNLATWAVFQRAYHTASSLQAEYDLLQHSGEVERWRQHAAYCRAKKAEPCTGIALDLWRRRIDVPSHLHRNEEAEVAVPSPPSASASSSSSTSSASDSASDSATAEPVRKRARS